MSASGELGGGADVGAASGVDTSVEALLGFWLGRWRVVARDGRPAGENLIELAVGGRAVLEHWRGVGGDEGTSIFFVDPATGQWKQLWVQAGCVKKKLHDPAWRDGVRFVGTALVGGLRIPDRTTLTPLDGGRVLQVIEQSRDGETWRVGFEAVYERLEAGAIRPALPQPAARRAWRRDAR